MRKIVLSQLNVQLTNVPYCRLNIKTPGGVLQKSPNFKILS